MSSQTAVPLFYLPVMLPFVSKPCDVVNGSCDLTAPVSLPDVRTHTLQTLVRTQEFSLCVGYNGL
mgnify:FL=1